jgi:hypothetical protein
MLQMRRLIAIALILPAAALAAPSERALVLATDLVRLLRFETTFNAYVEQCAKPEGSPFDPALAFRSDPASFGGISPQSAYWPDVKNAYARLQAKACAYATPEKFAKYFVDQFAERLSEDDLRTAVEFQQTASARRVQEAVVAANASFQSFATQLMYAAYESATKEFQQELRTLTRKYRQDPR